MLLSIFKIEPMRRICLRTLRGRSEQSGLWSQQCRKQWGRSESECQGFLACRKFPRSHRRKNLQRVKLLEQLLWKYSFVDSAYLHPYYISKPEWKQSAQQQLRETQATKKQCNWSSKNHVMMKVGRYNAIWKYIKTSLLVIIRLLFGFVKLN